jgi:uncharacterized membrane protein YGL010W
MSAFQAHLARYRQEHRTVGCRITHMIGVPTILTSLVVVWLHWQVGLAMFIFGWSLQFAGHRYFERNKPVLAEDPRNPYTYLSAVVFVAHEWVTVLSGRRLTAEPTIPKPELPKAA